MRRILILVVVVTACHGKRAGKDFFGTQVSPPGVLAQIRPGMTLAQVKTIAPAAKEDPGKGLLLAKPASNVKLYAITDRDLVEYTYADYAGDDGIAMLTQAWGPPDKEPDRGDLHEVAWRSTATGWRAAVFCGNGTDKVKLPPFCTITFHPHLPLEAMFGKRIAPPGEFAKVTPQMTIAQLKATTHLAMLTDAPTQTPIRWLDYDGATEHVGIVNGRLYSLDYTVPSTARAAMEKAWGPPTRDGDQPIWLDAKSGWCAFLSPSSADSSHVSIEFQGYQPFAALLDLFENLTKSRSVEDAKKAHPELDWSASDDLSSFWVAASELSDPGVHAAGMTGVGLFPEKDGVRVVMEQLDVTREPEIVDALTKRWGTPIKTTPDADHVEYRFPKHGVLMHGGHMLGIQVSSDP
jgi:hypothetical protein